MAAPTATHNATIKEYCIYVYVCEKLLLVVVVLLFSLEYFSILPARLDFSSIYKYTGKKYKNSVE